MSYFPNAPQPNVFTTISALSIAVEATIWTPASGKKFRLLGFLFAGSVTGNITLRDNTAGTVIFIIPGTAGIFITSPPMGFGILSAAANNVLTATGPALTTLSGVVFGRED